MASNDHMQEVFELPREPVMIPSSIPPAVINKSGIQQNGMTQYSFF